MVCNIDIYVENSQNAYIKRKYINYPRSSA